jgi:thioredoxin-related protein
VSRLEEEWKTGQVIKLNMMNPATREFGAEVGFQFTPTFILFDGEGKELKRWRSQPPELGELP